MEMDARAAAAEALWEDISLCDTLLSHVNLYANATDSVTVSSASAFSSGITTLIRIWLYKNHEVAQITNTLLQ